MRSRCGKCAAQWVEHSTERKRLKSSFVPLHLTVLIPSMHHLSPPRMSTKPLHRERESAPVPTDIAEKMIALKRKQAKYVSPIPASPNPPTPPPFPFHSYTPHTLCSQPYQSQGPRRTARSICLAEPSIITSPEATAPFRAVASKAYNQTRAGSQRVLSTPQAIPHPKAHPAARIISAQAPGEAV